MDVDPALRAFLDDDGRIRQMPAKHARRLLLLDHVAGAFEVGVHYPEAEVDAVLKRFWPDHAALRRYLVDAGMLTRDHGVYWRSGGTVR